MEGSERSGSLSFTDAVSFGRFNVLIQQPYRMTFWRYLTRVYETVRTMSRALENDRRETHKAQKGFAGTPLLQKRKCGEDGEEYLVHDGVCVLLEQLVEAAEEAEAALSLEVFSG